MSNVEIFWMYKHAWRGAGLYYRKGDHVVTHDPEEDKPSSMFKALTMYPVWDKWIMPRCEVIAPEYYDNPDKWALSKIDDISGPRSTPPSVQV